MSARHQKFGCYAEPLQPNCAFFKRVGIVDDFTGKTHECFFYEDKGRDISFARWRVCFYYESHMALTKFFASEAEKSTFLAVLEPEARA